MFLEILGMSSFKNILFVSKDFGGYLGHLKDNKIHNHYTIQLSVVLENPIQIFDDISKITVDKGVLIQSNVKHALECKGPNLMMMFNPTSKAGIFFKRKKSKPIGLVANQCTEDLASVSKEIVQGTLPTSDILKEYNKIYDQFEWSFEGNDLSIDDRILAAIEYLKESSERRITAAEVAEHCFLSESRFLHLFKKETGSTFKRAQVWFKFVAACKYIGSQSFTKTAHQFGFTDSAHFSRSFKENFGYSPTNYFKDSQFIQAL